MIDISSTVQRLVARRTEGEYWDYKERHHEYKYDLVHDVLCLANVKHRGMRFLIFGVSDDGTVRSLQQDKVRRTQAEIAALFRDNVHKFADSRYPEFFLTSVELQGHSVDVLVIEDQPHKPYYLMQRLGKIPPNHIYTRVRDTNTPIDRSAAPHEVDQMYMERHGIDLPLVDRVKSYLRNVDGWTKAPGIVNNEDDVWFYRPFPEITMHIVAASDVVACNEEWTRGEIGWKLQSIRSPSAPWWRRYLRLDPTPPATAGNNAAYHYEIKYHQTCIARIRCVTFDDHKKHMVAPNWESAGPGRFYFYELNSIEYALQRYLVETEGSDHSKTLRVGRLCEDEVEAEARCRFGAHLEIPVLRASELRDFVDSMGADSMSMPSANEAEQYNLFVKYLLEYHKWCDR